MRALSFSGFRVLVFLAKNPKTPAKPLVPNAVQAFQTLRAFHDHLHSSSSSSSGTAAAAHFWLPKHRLYLQVPGPCKPPQYLNLVPEPST